MRMLAAIALIAALAAGADIRQARLLLASKNLNDRMAGIRMLAGIDSRAAIQALEEAIRRSGVQLERLTPVMDRLDGKASDAYVDRLILELTGKRGTPEWRTAVKRQVRTEKELENVSRDIRLHFSIVMRAGDSFGKYRSDAAIGRLEEGARSETNPSIRVFYIKGLGHPTRERSIPALVALLQHRDSRVRAAVLRSLIPFAKQKIVRDAVRPQGEHPHWAVRLGVFQVMAGAPFMEAVEYLARAAGRETGELALTLDSYLEQLTGESFAQKPQHWPWWLKQNEKALRDGSYVRQSGSRQETGETRSVATFFRIPIDSRRLVFAIDFSGSMSDDLALKDTHINRIREKYGLPQTRLGYAKSELIHAIHNLPDGTEFNIIGYNNVARALSSRLMTASDSTRGRAIRWVRKAEAEYMTNIWDALRTAFKDYFSTSGGLPRFKDLPDTIIFLTDGNATRGRFRETRELVDLVRVWNWPVDLVIHCVGIGANQDRDLLATMASETGGFYVDLDKGLKSFKPRRRKMPRYMETEEPPGAEIQRAIALLEKGDKEQRVEAARTLGARGARARGVVEALAAAMREDQEEVVLAAAGEALGRIGKRAVPALIEALSNDDEYVLEAAAKALGVVGADAAASAPALVKLLESDRIYARVEAARAIGAIGPAAAAAARPALERILATGRKSELYDAASEALEKVTR
jgi:HEAT repeat protein